MFLISDVFHRLIFLLALVIVLSSFFSPAAVWTEAGEKDPPTQPTTVDVKVRYKDFSFPNFLDVFVGKFVRKIKSDTSQCVFLLTNSPNKNV